jgi:hypothetical protein
MNLDSLFSEVHYTLGLYSIQTMYENTIVNLTNAINETIADPDVETIDTVRVSTLQRAIGILQNEIKIVALELDALHPIPVSQNYFHILATSE